MIASIGKKGEKNSRLVSGAVQEIRIILVAIIATMNGIRSIVFREYRFDGKINIV